jgi:hypothetical protein
MKVTKRELRKIIKEAVDMSGLGPIDQPQLNHKTVTMDFVSLINELGPEAFASALVRAFGDLERADDTVAYIRRMG